MKFIKAAITVSEKDERINSAQFNCIRSNRDKFSHQLVPFDVRVKSINKTNQLRPIGPDTKSFLGE